jgi:hypothetical protein
MKRKISEQTTEKTKLPALNAGLEPMQEKEKLEANPAWKNPKFEGKRLVTLDGNVKNDTPKSVNVENTKSYTYAYAWFSPKKNKNIYLVYDGAILYKNENGTYSFFRDANNNIIGNLSVDKGIVADYDKYLKSIGLLYSDDDLMYKLEGLFSKLQELINRGYKGKFFINFNRVLDRLYPTNQDLRLKGSKSETGEEAAKSFYPNQFETQMKQDYVETTDTLRQFGLSNVLLWAPKGDKLVAGRSEGRGSNARDIPACKTLLVQYFQFGAENAYIEGMTSDATNICNMKSKIRACSGAGSYDSLKLGKEELFGDNFNISKDKKDILYSKGKSGILGGITRLTNKKLTYDEIVQITRNEFKGDWDLSVPCKNVPTSSNTGAMMENHKKLKSRIHNILLETYLRKRYNRK